MRDPIFILYDSRSGSTLFAALLNRAKGVSVSLESGFVTTVLRQLEPFSTDASIVRLVDDLFREVQFQELGIERAGLERTLLKETRPIPSQVVIERIMDACFAAVEPNTVRVLKHAPYFDMDAVLAVFPESRFLHLIRDGRAVFESKRRTRSISGDELMQANLIRAAHDWRTKSSIANALGANVLTLRYEDLLERPDTVIGQALDFLGIPESERVFTKTQEEYQRAIGERQQGLHKRAGEKPRQELRTHWRSVLAEPDALVYELVAGDALDAHGYERVGSDPAWRTALRPSVLARLTFWSIHFVAHNLRRLMGRVARGESLPALVRRHRRLSGMQRRIRTAADRARADEARWS